MPHVPPTLNADATDALLAWAARVEAEAPFRAAQHIARRLGAHPTGDGRAAFGFWAPELEAANAVADSAVLEVFVPPPDLDLAAAEQQVSLTRHAVPLRRQGVFLWGVVDGLRPGTRETVGPFYQVKYQTTDGAWHAIPDYLAYSVPFGAFAPAELYDMDRLQQERGDGDYFAALSTQTQKNGRPQLGPPAHILQIHPATSTEAGTLAGLTRKYQQIAAKIESGVSLSPAEENYIGYEAIQLMPIEPTIEYEAGPAFFQPATDAPEPGAVDVTLRAPDITNWGYDILIAGSGAVNPSILETKRPDELADFAATLHTFPTGPIKLIVDVVFGHTDNQAVDILNDDFLAGPGMYGMNMQFRHPVTRAVMLEMQRRKGNLGADGIRVDGAQDFKVWDPETEQLYYDDAYLQAMSDVVQTTAGVDYYPWMIFEDGRPWPQDDWELSSTYRAVIEDQPDTFQWSPLTFAHNTPFLFTFWVSKWWRIREMAERGSHWITGCANHDTLRRGAQVDPQQRINTYLGETLPAIIENAYDHPAANLLTYGLLPGVPMDFLHALMRAPWSFIRNTDDRYGVKVAAEEARFLDWRVTEARYQQPEHFRRLKARGFTHLKPLRRFMTMLAHAVEATNYDLDAVVKLLRAADPPLAGPALSVPALKQIARDWMDDVHDYCNVAHYAEGVDPERAAFNRSVRRFRSARPWLMDDLRAGEALQYRHPCDGTVLFYGLRQSPNGAEQILFAGNMEGGPVTFTPTDLPIDGLSANGWQVALQAPGLSAEAASQPLTLRNGAAVLFVRP